MEAAHLMSIKLTTGLSFINIIQAAFAPVGLRQFDWRSVYSVQHESKVYFLAIHTSKVGRIFVGESERRLLVPKNDHRQICALRHKVGEIDP